MQLTFDTFTRTDLELPLGGHDLSVSARDLNTSEQARLEVCLDDISTEDLSGTNTTVVWTLWAWETVGWPSVRSIGHIEKSVLLF